MTRPRLSQLHQSDAADGEVPVWDAAAGMWVPGAGSGGGGGSYTDPLTTKGDLVTRTSSVTTRKAVGSAGQVLIPDSTQTDGLKWSSVLGLGEAAPSLATLWVKRLSTDYCIVGLSTNSDSADINFQKAILVKHDALYTATPGYAGTLQVYMEAGGAGTILGANRYVGNTATPSYAPTETETADGFVRFELGPIWPRSEVGRFNNQGDFIVGWTEVRKHTASQSGSTVTATAGSFSASDVGKFFCWGDVPSLSGGAQAVADRITAYSSSTVVTVETSRTISSQKARVCTPRLWVDTAGNLTIVGDLSANDAAFSGSVTIAGDLTVTGTLTASTASSGELLMQDGVTGPPVPLETEARDDWLYEG